VYIQPQKIDVRLFSLFSFLLTSAGVAGQFPANYTPTYTEIISTYRQLATDHPEHLRLDSIGTTDAGLPLHYVVLAEDASLNPQDAERNGQLICMVMNGIHAGEACGINASISFAINRATDPDPNIVYIILPVYNVGGALNRNSHSRANQNGPDEYGFRANAKNLDLNRDFIKCDSENAKSFTRLYHLWNPHVFVDTHTSNGADYQPSMTLLASFPEKLFPMQRTFVEREMIPQLFEGMKQLGDEMIPYVDLRGQTPEEGIEAFIDYPRYGSGYVSLFNTLAFLTEAHMLKPFNRRVDATMNFLLVLHEFLSDRHELVVKLKSLADAETAGASSFATKWQLGTETDSVEFPGYAAKKTGSLISGRNYYEYDRNQPYRKLIPYYHDVNPLYEAELPDFFVIPQAWKEVIERLEMNEIKLTRFDRDTTLEVTSLYARYFETADEPYEGHYPHANVGVVERRESVDFRKGDVLIATDQPGNRYLAHVLDPQSHDSFFSWNFFDAVLTQKEYFSAYLFEPTAKKILERDVSLRRSFDSKKATDPAFAEDGVAQLKFIYENSVFHEKGHLRIPVFRLE
jgi:hypothetical protein